MKLDLSRLIDDGFKHCAELSKLAESFKLLPELVVEKNSKLKPDKLIHGDNLLTSIALKQENQKFQLIYIDPPYASNSNYNLKLRVGETNQKIKIPVYSDFWRKGLQSYLSMLFPRLYFMRNLLNDEGAIFVHVDTKASHYVKVLMDCIFGAESFVNEIIYRKDAGQRVRNYFPRKHDVILFYAKNIEKLKFNLHSPLLRTDYNDIAVKMHFKPDKNQRLMRKYPSGKLFYKDLGKLFDDIWDDISTQQASSPIMSETTGFETQKPAALLERIISAVTDSKETYHEKLALDKFMINKKQHESDYQKQSAKKQEMLLHNWTNEFFLDAKAEWLDKTKKAKIPCADTVADFFAGSGTTGVTAHQLKRSFVLCEVDRTAWFVALKRILQSPKINLQCLRATKKSSKQNRLNAKKIQIVDAPERLDSEHQRQKVKSQTIIAPVTVKLIKKKYEQRLKLEIPEEINKQLTELPKHINVKHEGEFLFDFCMLQLSNTENIFAASESFTLNKINDNEYQILETFSSRKFENASLRVFDIFGNIYFTDQVIK